jgi:transposase
MTLYAESFKSKMVQKMCGPGAVSATALGKEVGVAQATLSRWLLRRGGGSLAAVSTRREAITKRRSGTTRPAAEKIRLVTEARRLEGEERGAFLRREGVHETEIAEWESILVAALDGEPGRAAARQHAEDKREVEKLRREVRRKDKALAETAALLVLQKKVREIWGDEDDDTGERNDK